MLWCCDNPECRTLYAAFLYGGCPHCHHPEFHEFGSQPSDEEHPMSPKITRAGGPTDGTETTEPAQVDTVVEPAPPGLQRPGVNDPKGDHVAYAELAHGLNPEIVGESFTKRQLIAVLDQLEAGDLVVADGEIVDPAQESEGTGEPMEAIEVAEGETGELTGDGSGEPLPPAEDSDDASEPDDAPVS